MQINKAIREIMREKHITLSAMGKSLHKTDKNTGETVSLTPNDVSSRLNYPHMSFLKAIEMLDVLGYEIVLQEKKPGPRRADQIVIDQKE